MYLKKSNSILVIKNDEEALLTNINMRERSKQFKSLEREMSQMRREFDQLKVLVLELIDAKK